MSIPIRNIVAYAHVVSVPKSIQFYETLGFRVDSTHSDRNEIIWAWMKSERGNLMLAKASGPIDREQQAILFYVYVDDVSGKRNELSAAGLSVSPLTHPFWAPEGEFRVVDPDGYSLLFIKPSERVVS